MNRDRIIRRCVSDARIIQPSRVDFHSQLVYPVQRIYGRGVMVAILSAPQPLKELAHTHSTFNTRMTSMVVPYRTIFRWLIMLRKSPRAISGGFALGTFIAFTPTIGIQIGIAIFLATLLNVNRPAAVIMVWITNAATMAPIYAFNYLIGTIFWQGPPVKEVYHTFQQLAVNLLKFEMWDMLEQFQTILQLGKEIIIPLCFGSTIVGLVAAGIVYGISQSLLRFMVARREKKRGEGR